jgi:hypothetical protein
MTPEGKVKAKVKKLINWHLTLSPQLIYTYMPVPGGFGSPSLDFIGCASGHFYAVETKAKGKKLTAQQEQTARVMRQAGAAVFEVIGDDGLEELDRWLSGVLGHGCCFEGPQVACDPLPRGRGKRHPASAGI